MKKKIILLSGSSRGIGASLAEELYQTGYYLSLGVRNTSSLDNVIKNWSADRILSHYYDAKIPSTARDWVEKTIDKFGQIDGVINCAGILKACEIENFDEIALDELWTVNAKAPISLVHAAWPYLKKSGSSRIINIVSLAGKRVSGIDFGYSMSKYALLAFTHAIRQAGWEYGIRTTAICPNWVNTDMAKDICPHDLTTITQPADIASIVKTVLGLPNTVSVSEITVNFELDNLY